MNADVAVTLTGHSLFHTRQNAGKPDEICGLVRKTML